MGDAEGGAGGVWAGDVWAGGAVGSIRVGAGWGAMGAETWAGGVHCAAG